MWGAGGGGQGRKLAVPNFPHGGNARSLPTLGLGSNRDLKSAERAYGRPLTKPAGIAQESFAVRIDQTYANQGMLQIGVSLVQRTGACEWSVSPFYGRLVRRSWDRDGNLICAATPPDAIAASTASASDRIVGSSKPPSKSVSSRKASPKMPMYKPERHTGKSTLEGAIVER